MSAQPRGLPAFPIRRTAAEPLAAQHDPASDSTFLVSEPEVLARRAAEGQRDRHGEPLALHLERVAAAVAPEARRVALLHEVLERETASVDELELAGLSTTEIAAVRLLTRAPGESFELHLVTIAHAHGPEGRLARLVALADIDDHLAHETERHPASATPYRWARRHLDIALGHAAA